ncbi:MAG: tripartite tricarboxylate transporter substrate binding protein [Betaproteobacteria bacterium]|nr:tripartite tricarboxylate transporter substrate binding protein [Betaproteobacteria bacterium]
MWRGTSLISAAALGAIVVAAGWAQTYPVKPVRIISPYPPGGGNDTLARTISQRLGEQLGQQVIVDNRPGANTIIGTELAAKSPPDGYTIILVPSSHAINQSLYRRLPYDAIRDFSPITLAGSGPLILVVHPSLPAASVRELIALARAKPGELTFASAGNGSSGHLAGVLFGLTVGVKLVHVPYKGTAPAVTDLLGGQVTMTFGTTLGVLPHVRSGKLRALGVASLRRSPAAPGIPTIAESGVPGYSASLWYGFLAPANTPKDIVQRLSAEISRVLKLPEIRERLSNLGIDPHGSAPEEFARLIAADLEKWAKVVKESGARID